MKRLFAMLTLVAILLTGCSVSNEVTDDQTTNIQQVDSSATDSGESKQDRPDRTKKEDEPEDIACFELNDTFQNLLDEVNAEHEAVKMYAGDYEQYYVKNEEPGFNFRSHVVSAVSKYPSNDTVLTLEQIKEDLEICYKALRTEYGCYTYLGGDEVFRAAIDAVIADCSALDVITCGDFQNSLKTHLSFISDCHFRINGKSVGQYWVPFFFRNVAYQKTDTGYETLDGKRVVSVDGYENLDDLFKLSLTKEGDLVYYPILLELADNPMGPASCTTPTLTVRYADGSTDELNTGQYFFKRTLAEPNMVEVQEENGVPVIAAGMLWADSYGSMFEKSAKEYKGRDITVLDLRSCGGGLAQKVETWAMNYAGRPVWSHAPGIIGGSSLNPSDKYGLSHADEEFAPMDGICIMLSSKCTASAGELMIDMGFNMENTLIIGENTQGCLTSSLAYILKMPNSGVFVLFGDCLKLHPDNEHFEEFRGYYPDIWCPADEAKEAVMNFIAKNTTVTYEQTEK